MFACDGGGRGEENNKTRQEEEKRKKRAAESRRAALPFSLSEFASVHIAISTTPTRNTSTKKENTGRNKRNGKKEIPKAPNTKKKKKRDESRHFCGETTARNKRPTPSLPPPTPCSRSLPCPWACSPRPWPPRRPPTDRIVAVGSGPTIPARRKTQDAQPRHARHHKTPRDTETTIQRLRAVFKYNSSLSSVRKPGHR